MTATAWILSEAVALCRQIEEVCPAFGCHVALTGGLLYKLGERKDCDILFYRIREVDEIDVAGLLTGLTKLGIEADPEHAGASHEDELWCVKATWKDRSLDIFFPEPPPSADIDTVVVEGQLL